MTSLTINKKFNGPPTTGNGGYCCGTFAATLGNSHDTPIEVTLKSPPPLDQPLQSKPTDVGIEIWDNETPVAIVKPGQLDIEYPKPPTLEQSIEASKHYSGYDHHVFPTCFVCGTARSPSDGLCIYPGPTPDRSQVAGPWQPYPELADENGMVRPEFIWAALDCPSYFGTFINHDNAKALLGRMTLQILSSNIPADQPYIVTAWPGEHDGRKRYGGSALFSLDGECLALSHGTWILL